MVQDAEKYKTEDEEARRKVCWRGGSARPLRMCRLCMKLSSGLPLCLERRNLVLSGHRKARHHQ